MKFTAADSARAAYLLKDLQALQLAATVAGPPLQEGQIKIRNGSPGTASACTTSLLPHAPVSPFKALPFERCARACSDLRERLCHKRRHCRFVRGRPLLTAVR